MNRVDRRTAVLAPLLAAVVAILIGAATDAGALDDPGDLPEAVKPPVLAFDEEGTLQWVYRFSTCDIDNVRLTVDEAGDLFLWGGSRQIDVLTRDGEYQRSFSHDAGARAEAAIGRDGVAVLWWCDSCSCGDGNEFRELMAYNAAGEPAWSRRFETPEYFFGYAGIVSFVQDAAGNSFVIEEPYWRVVKVNAAGDEQWDTRFAEPDDLWGISAFAVDANGALLLYGNVDRGSSPNEVLLKIDASGELRWRAESWVETDAAGGFGSFCLVSAGAEGQVWLVCQNSDNETNVWIFDQNGNLTAANSIDQPIDTHNLLIHPGPDDGLFVASSAINFGMDPMLFYLLKVGADGQELWRAQYEPPNEPLDGESQKTVDVTDVGVDSEGNAYVWGLGYWQHSGKGKTAPNIDYEHTVKTLYTLLKYDPASNLLWAHNYWPEPGDDDDDNDDDDDTAFSARTAGPEDKADDDDGYTIYVGGGGNLVLTDRWSFPPYEEDDDDDDDTSPNPPDDDDDDPSAGSGQRDEEACGCGCG